MFFMTKAYCAAIGRVLSDRGYGDLPVQIGAAGAPSKLDLAHGTLPRGPMRVVLALGFWKGDRSMLVDDPVFDAVLRGLVLAAAGLAWVTLLIRLNGLRSLSKMSNFDFVMTIALGSLLSGAARSSEWTGFVQALAAMVSLFAVQWGLNQARVSWPPFQNFVQNRPVVLLRDGEFQHDAMRKTRVARSDLLEKLREANVSDISQVRAVILETTGDVSVVQGETLDERLLEGVDRAGG
jgi:uncharacterized membrane protein YcaP (DUF421 family)